MKALVVRPDYFEIDYKVNYWLPKNITIDRKKLFRQYDNLLKHLQKYKIEIRELKQIPEMPSMVYCRDWGFVDQDRTFFLAKFKPQPRRKESKFARKLFSEMSYKVLTPPDRDYYSVADLIVSEGKYYFGWGKRSAVKSKDFFEKHLKTEIVDFRISDHRFDHLDKCVGPIDSNSSLYYLEALSMIEQARICYHFPNVIPIGEQDAEVYATSFIKLENTLLMPEGISNYLKEEISRLGMEITELDISEYLKGGQGLRSLVLFF